MRDSIKRHISERISKSKRDIIRAIQKEAESIACDIIRDLLKDEEANFVIKTNELYRTKFIADEMYTAPEEYATKK